jgi:hypothetical protein
MLLLGKYYRLVLLLAVAFIQGACCLTLLSDLKTPAFLLDLQVLQQRLDASQGTTNTPIPPIGFQNQQHMLLVPIPLDSKDSQYQLDDAQAAPLRLLDETAMNAPPPPGLYYLHSRVVNPREAACADNPAFLAALDLPPGQRAQLVLGLNNHHVGSYYWARSAGSGAAMEAPGIVLLDGNDDNGRADHCNGGTSHLCWESVEGPTACNSNDGKRSEWVNFLRPGDQVQLRPFEPVEAALAEFVKHGIFGVSSKGRPMGSEPAVVCEWKIV